MPTNNEKHFTFTTGQRLAEAIHDNNAEQGHRTRMYDTAPDKEPPDRGAVSVHTEVAAFDL